MDGGCRPKISIALLIPFFRDRASMAALNLATEESRKENDIKHLSPESPISSQMPVLSVSESTESTFVEDQIESDKSPLNASSYSQPCTFDGSQSSSQLSLPSPVYGDPGPPGAELDNHTDYNPGPSSKPASSCQKKNDIKHFLTTMSPCSSHSSPVWSLGTPNSQPLSQSQPSSSRNTNSSQNSCKEKSRVSQEISAQERYIEVKEWRDDEERREMEKRILGFDTRKEELRWSRDTEHEKQQGWL